MISPWRMARRRGYRASTAFPPRKSALFGLALRFAFRDRSVAIFTEALGPQKFHGRAVLLVNQHTASAAEMMTGFVKENRLATIVGTRTAGQVLGGRSVQGNCFDFESQDCDNRAR